MSFHWFIPALVNISVGSSLMTIGADGTMVCPCCSKNFLYDSLISFAVIIVFSTKFIPHLPHSGGWRHWLCFVIIYSSSLSYNLPSVQWANSPLYGLAHVEAFAYRCHMAMSHMVIYYAKLRNFSPTESWCNTKLYIINSYARSFFRVN